MGSDRTRALAPRMNVNTAAAAEPLRSKQQSSYVAPRLATTPLLRSSPRQTGARSIDAQSTAIRSPHYHHVATPPPAQPHASTWSANVTPRSSSRTARVQSATPSPASSPMAVASPSMPRSRAPVNTSSSTAGAPARSGATLPSSAAQTTVSRHRALSSTSATSSASTGRMLKSPRQGVTRIRPQTSPKSTIGIPSPSQLSPRNATIDSPIGCSVHSDAPISGETSRKRPPSQFFYADGKPERHIDSPSSGRSTPIPQTLLSTPIQSPSGASGRSSTVHSPPTSGPVNTFERARTRSTSPLKKSTNASVISSSKRSTLPATKPRKEPKFAGFSHAQASVNQSQSTEPDMLTRPETRSICESPTDQNDPKQFLSSSPHGTSNQQAEHRPAALAEISRSRPSSLITSAALSNVGELPSQPEDHQKALAAQARRERKVLDLEISNSSLLAINRALERTSRKQLAELRRFRRLTSSGRLSLSRPRLRPSAASSRSDDSSEGASHDHASDSSDPSSAENENDLDEGISESEDQSLSDVTSAHQHLRDEKRLQVDLHKHRELLANSQRLNSSLGRCLGRTDALIRDGRKALAYRVGASDVQLGGRVLPADSTGADAVPSGQGLLSPAIEHSGFDLTRESLESATAAASDALDLVDDLSETGMVAT